MAVGAQNWMAWSHPFCASCLPCTWKKLIKSGLFFGFLRGEKAALAASFQLFSCL